MFFDEEITQDEEEIITDSEQQFTTEEDTTDWRAEALKHKAIADRLKKKMSTQTIIQPKQEHEDEVVKTVQRLSMLEEKRQFGFENQLSPEETDFIFKFSSKPTKEILSDPFVKAGLDGYRQSKRLENNTPSTSSRSPIFTDKPFEELSEDDRRKAFESKMKAIKK